MQPVSQLDDDDADILRHRHENLPEIFRFFLLLRLEYDLVEFGHSADKFQYFVAELPPDIFFSDGRVLDDVMQKRRRNRRGVQPQLHEDFRHGAGMNEIGLAGSALLIGMRFFRVVIRFQEQCPILIGIQLVNFFPCSVHRLSPFSSRRIDFRRLSPCKSRFHRSSFPSRFLRPTIFSLAFQSFRAHSYFSDFPDFPLFASRLKFIPANAESSDRWRNPSIPLSPRDTRPVSPPKRPPDQDRKTR